MKNLIIISILLFSIKADAQLLDSIYKNQKKGISYNHQSVSQYHYYSRLYMIENNIPAPKDRNNSIVHFKREENFDGLFFHYRYNATDKWGHYFRYDNRKISDLLTHVYILKFKHDSVAGSLSSFVYDGVISTGYFGEVNYGRNVFVNNKKDLVVSAGAFFADMDLPGSYYGIGGYHLVGGAFANVDKVIGKNLVARVSYAKGSEFVSFKHNMEGIDRPKYAKLELELIHANGWYTGFEETYFDNSRVSKRSSLKVGYRFNKIGRK